ncbi:pseudouridylate synthase TRUB2, mitochondrial [Musca domestica]|uniref:Pseudouridylate synthase TRUB2, mitochondrial n=1 Tax=Musca domestica TaxID=7370 RepID=A0ABM3VGG7_MUSDO|nr:pseudouridylate synthase TRUB2, mitochondrial [Musca domestica]
MALQKVRDASLVFRNLNGIINVYKPAGMKIKHVRAAILHNICEDLNALKANNEPESHQIPLLEPGGAADPLLRKVNSLNLAEHVLSTGPRYQMEDIRCATVASLGVHTSGVLLFGINKGLKQSMRIQRNRPIRAYHVTGQLGKATETHLPDSHITLKANYRHVHPDRLSALVSSLQASHQCKMFELCGVDMQSQAAYEIACKGLIRPANNSQPIIYGIKLIDFQKPHFTLEIHAINESESYLATLVHEIGIELRTVAHCTALRCIRHGKFSVEGALLRHAWNLPGVVRNMREQKEILEAHPYLLKQDRIELRN